MTREEILAMEASPEMDDMIEELIFQRTEKSFDGIYTNRWRFKRRDDEEEKGLWFPALSYSTDISAAWEVVEKIKEKDPFRYVGDIKVVWGDYGKNLTPKGPHGQMVYPNDLCWLVIIETETNAIKVTAKTAPEAICKAALLAVMNQ